MEVKKLVINEVDNGNSKDNKLWNLNFFLLWQGQLISSYGNSIYKIALGFWILTETGSTAMMGIMMAAMSFPSIFISPLAGTFVDRYNKKKIVVITDIVSGITTILIGVLALNGNLKVWVVILGGIILGVCSCVFKPAVHSTIPLILSKNHLVKGNSAMSLASTGTDIIGKSTSGFLLQLLGSPILFLVNGISFILSAISECFICIPESNYEIKTNNFFKDLKDGFEYVKNFKGIKYMYVTFAFLNFFAVMGITLLLPLFNSKSYLGSGKYGITMAILSVGMFITYSLLSIVDISHLKKSKLFIVSGVISGSSLALLPITSNYYIITLMIFFNGIFFAIVSMLMKSTLQASVSKNMLGKTCGFEKAISSSLMPLAMIIGGFLGEMFPIELIISFDFIIITLLFGVLVMIKPVIKLLDSY